METEVLVCRDVKRHCFSSESCSNSIRAATYAFLSSFDICDTCKHRSLCHHKMSNNMFTTNAISMLLAFITLFTATIAIPTSTSLDTVKRCNALIETVPWQLVNIQLFNATVPGNSTSSINFHFCDTSPGLEIETECGYIFPSGQNATPAYQPCVNQTIGFTYSDGLIQVAREYQDHW